MLTLKCLPVEFKYIFCNCRVVRCLFRTNTHDHLYICMYLLELNKDPQIYLIRSTGFNVDLKPLSDQEAFPRPLHGILTFLWSPRWSFMALVRRFHCACAALLVFVLRFQGVRTALPRRSGTALTACRRNRNDVSLICAFAFKMILLSQFWHQSMKMTMLKSV